jgi:hypothetical protein
MDWVIEDHLMPRTLYHVYLDIVEILFQASSAILRHPILVAEKEVHSDLHIHLPQDLLYAADGLQGPFEQGVETSLTILTNADDMFQVLFPS